jgi:cell division protein FtsL
VVEFYTVKRIDNSRLARRRAPGFGRTCFRQLALGGVVALAMLGYTWQHYQCLQLSYQLERLDHARSQAVELNRELRVERATLRSPARIDVLARNQLGMTLPQPAQVVLTQSRTAGEVADARTTSIPASFR